MAQVLKLDAMRFYANAELLKKVMEQKNRQALDDVGAFVVSEVKDRTPIDEGFLTEDVEYQVYLKDKVVVIRIPINATSSSYAVKMHEGDYNLGPRSAGKAVTTGKIVGPGYISRSISEESETIKEIVIKDLQL